MLDQTGLVETMSVRFISTLGSNSFIEKIPFWMFSSIEISVIQPYFDYACIAWYPHSSKKLQDKLQVTQNKFIRFS